MDTRIESSARMPTGSIKLEPKGALNEINKQLEGLLIDADATARRARNVADRLFGGTNIVGADGVVPHEPPQSGSLDALRFSYDRLRATLERLAIEISRLEEA